MKVRLYLKYLLNLPILWATWHLWPAVLEKGQTHAKEVYIKNQFFEYYDNLNKPKNLETKIIVINENHRIYLMIHFSRLDCGKEITMSNLYYHILKGKFKIYEGRNYLRVKSYVLDRVLENI